MITITESPRRAPAGRFRAPPKYEFKFYFPALYAKSVPRREILLLSDLIEDVCYLPVWFAVGRAFWAI